MLPHPGVHRLLLVMSSLIGIGEPKRICEILRSRANGSCDPFVFSALSVSNTVGFLSVSIFIVNLVIVVFCVYRFTHHVERFFCYATCITSSKLSIFHHFCQIMKKRCRNQLTTSDLSHFDNLRYFVIS